MLRITAPDYVLRGTRTRNIVGDSEVGLTIQPQPLGSIQPQDGPDAVFVFNPDVENFRRNGWFFSSTDNLVTIVVRDADGFRVPLDTPDGESNQFQFAIPAGMTVQYNAMFESLGITNADRAGAMIIDATAPLNAGMSIIEIAARRTRSGSSLPRRSRSSATTWWWTCPAPSAATG